MFSKLVNNPAKQKDSTFIHKHFALISQHVSEYYKILKNFFECLLFWFLINIDFMLLFYLPLQAYEQHNNKLAFKESGLWHTAHGWTVRDIM